MPYLGGSRTPLQETRQTAGGLDQDSRGQQSPRNDVHQLPRAQADADEITIVESTTFNGSMMNNDDHAGPDAGSATACLEGQPR